MKRETVIILVLLGVALLLYLRRFGLAVPSRWVVPAKPDSQKDAKPDIEGVVTNFATVPDNSANVVSDTVEMDYPNPYGGLFAPRMMRGPAVLVLQRRLNDLVRIGELPGPFLEEDSVYDLETKKKHDLLLEKVAVNPNVPFSPGFVPMRKLSIVEKYFEWI